MFRLSLKSLILFCHQLGVMTSAGVPLRRALATLQRLGRGRLRRVTRDIADDIGAGHTFAQAIERRGRAFPALARNLVVVGEATGNLDDVLKQLADYYEMQRSILKQMLSKMILPIIQYLAAIGVLAIVAWIRQTFMNQPPAGFFGSPTGILVVGWGVVPGVWVGYLVVTRTLGGARPVHEILLQIPLLRRAMRSFAVGRFAWCMALCVESAVRIVDALRLSLKATGNQAFAARERAIVDRVKGGATVAGSLAETRLFPVEFIEIASVGEESGKLSESFRHQAKLYFEDARASASALATLASGLVWVLIAGFIIYQIFLMAGAYLRALPI